MTDQLANRWNVEKIRSWYDKQPWLCGFNYVTSNAINTTEMWHHSSVDFDIIDRELTWAEEIGFNSCRIFLQYLVWQEDPHGLIARLDHFLTIANHHHLSTIVCLFDDCAFSGKEPYLGPQDPPLPGVHNSGWVPSPGHVRVVDQSTWKILRNYISMIIGWFREDDRILFWDLYNEPGNAGMGEASLNLLNNTFLWARYEKPNQPITVGIWNSEYKQITKASIDASDLITFHNYSNENSLNNQIENLEQYERPIVCTEWMRRNYGSIFSTHLPIFRKNNVGCYFWGLVNGKTQTHFPWGSHEGASEPEIWFHDLLHKDGNAYDNEELSFIKNFLKSS